MLQIPTVTTDTCWMETTATTLRRRRGRTGRTPTPSASASKDASSASTLRKSSASSPVSQCDLRNVLWIICSKKKNVFYGGTITILNWTHIVWAAWTIVNVVSELCRSRLSLWRDRLCHMIWIVYCSRVSNRGLLSAAHMPGEAWVGLNDRATEGQYVYTDGSDAVSDYAPQYSMIHITVQ